MKISFIDLLFNENMKHHLYSVCLLVICGLRSEECENEFGLSKKHLDQVFAQVVTILLHMYPLSGTLEH